MRIVIAEEALETGAGHWPAYIGCIATGLQRMGDSVDILVHEDARSDVVPGIQSIPHFSRNCWLDSASQGGMGGIRHNLIFYRELSGFLTRAEIRYDWCFSLTMRIQHLLAYARISRSRKIMGNTRFLLLFVQGFGVYQWYQQPVCFPRNPTNLLARFCFRIMSKAVRAGRFVLAAETKGMQQELGRFTKLPVSLFPHPVPSFEADSTGHDDNQEIVITAPGFARHEKGTDLLQGAIESLLMNKNLPAVRFILQWPDAFQMPDGSRLGPLRQLLQDDRVEFQNDSLDAAGYQALINRSDLIILPYRRNSYHNRLSRVAIEAAVCGKPLIYTTGTWTEEVVQQGGIGIPIESESVDAVEKAILQAIDSIDDLSQRAKSGSANVAGFNSAGTFRKTLMGEGIK